MPKPPFTVSHREPARHDNKLILQCPSCHMRSLVDVKPQGETRWICPNFDCLSENLVKSDLKSRDEWNKHLKGE